MRTEKTAVGESAGDAHIRVEHLQKRYGSTVAISDVSFTVRSGLVSGFVGPNGAGKSTTMRIILGLDTPDRGTALVAGRPYRSLCRPLCRVGALLDAGAVQPDHRARDHLLWIAQSNGLPRARIGEVLELVGLSSVAGKRVSGFSLGMRQRLGLAAALLGDPPILLLDEPATGLDPEGIHWLRGLLRQLAGEGRSVLVASHLMSELENTADHLIVIGQGRIIADCSVAALISRSAAGRLQVQTTRPSDVAGVLTAAGASTTPAPSSTTTLPAPIPEPQGGRPATQASAPGTTALIVSGITGEQAAAALTGADLPFSELGPHRPSLEAAYFELTAEVARHRSQPMGDS